MMYYVMVEVPQEIGSIKNVKFTEEQTSDHTVWELTNTPWIIHKYNAPRYNPLSKWKVNLMSADQFFKLALYIYEQGRVSSFDFDVEVDPDDPGEEELNQQRLWLLRGQDLTPQQIQKGMEYLDYLKTEGIELDSFKCIVSVNGRFNEITINKASAITYLNSDIKEEMILQMYQEIATFLIQKPVSIFPVILETYQKVPHPLQRQQEVLQRLFTLSGDKVKMEMKVSDEEWEWIQQDALQHADGKDGVVYEHEARNLLSKLKPKGKVI